MPNARLLVVIAGGAGFVATSAPFTYSRIVVPSEVAARCIHVVPLFGYAVGESTRYVVPLAVELKRTNGKPVVASDSS